MTRLSLTSLFFVFCCSLTSVVFAHRNLDTLSDAIENDRFATLSKLAEKFDTDADVSLQQFTRFQNAVKNASPDMIEHVEKIGLGFLPEETKEDVLALKEKLNSARLEPSLLGSLSSEIKTLMGQIGSDPKVWFFLILSNATALAQNTTSCDPGCLSQDDLNNILNYTRVSFILNWTMIAVLVIAPVAIGVAKCCCCGGSK